MPMLIVSGNGMFYKTVQWLWSKANVADYLELK